MKRTAFAALFMTAHQLILASNISLSAIPAITMATPNVPSLGFFPFILHNS
jgi:hypothetical protein